MEAKKLTFGDNFKIQKIFRKRQNIYILHHFMAFEKPASKIIVFDLYCCTLALLGL